MSKKSKQQAQAKKPFVAADNSDLYSLNSITASSVAAFSLLPWTASQTSNNRPITYKTPQFVQQHQTSPGQDQSLRPLRHSQTSSSTLAYSSSQNDTANLLSSTSTHTRLNQRNVAIQTETSFILAHHENSSDDIDCDLLTDNSNSDSAQTVTTTNSDYDSEMEKITWALGYDHFREMESDFYRSSRPNGPDPEMMALGKRFNDPSFKIANKACGNILLLDGVVDQESCAIQSDGDDEISVDDDSSYISQPIQKFSILPPHGLVKPVATRRAPPTFLEYYPISPPSSERTLPSETGSDISSSGVHSSIISSPDFARAASICSNSKSAFKATSHLTESKGSFGPQPYSSANLGNFQLKARPT